VLSAPRTWSVAVLTGVAACLLSGCGPSPGDQSPDLPPLEGTDGPLTGYVYLTPPPPPAAATVGTRQQIGTYFIVALAENPALGAPAVDGTAIAADTGETTTTTGGLFAFDALPVGLRSLTVTGDVSGVQQAEQFSGFLVIPETRTAPALSITVQPSNLPKVAQGDTTRLTATLLASGREVVAFPPSDFTWSSQFEPVATVGPDGTVTGVAPGQVRVAASVAGMSGVAAVWVTGGAEVPVDEVWSGSVTSYLDNGYKGYNFRTANIVEDPDQLTGEADFHMSGLGVIQAWGTGAINLGPSADFSAALVPPSGGYLTDPLPAAAGEVVVVRRRHGGYAVLRVTELVAGRTRRMDFQFIILSLR